MINKDEVFISVNRKRVSLAAFETMDKSLVKDVDVSYCAAITSLNLPAAETVYARGCTAITSLNLPAAETVYARGCTAITSLNLPAAEYVDVSFCTAITSLNLPAAKVVDVRCCTVITSLDLPAAKTVDARGCTAITSLFQAGRDRRGFYFIGVIINGAWRVLAGCRNFDFEQAKKHWGPGGKSDRPDCFAMVNDIIRHAEQFNLVGA